MMSPAPVARTARSATNTMIVSRTRPGSAPDSNWRANSIGTNERRELHERDHRLEDAAGDPFGA